MVTSDEFAIIQSKELGYWQHTPHMPDGSWKYYDSVFMPYVGLREARTDERVVVDLGCGPVPYFCNGKIPYDMAYAVDPLIGEYMKLARYDYLRAGNEFSMLKDTSTIEDGTVDELYALNILDHAMVPDDVLTEMGRVIAPGGMLFLFVDVEKEPDTMHPHKLDYQHVVERLNGMFIPVLVMREPSWKFQNDVLWYVGERK